MSDVLKDALILLVLLQVKHMFADFYLQTPRMLEGRGRYLHLGRMQHAGLHMVGSILAFLLTGSLSAVALWIVVIEGLAHYHIDWGKGRYSQMKAHTPTDAGYWRAFGFDQTLHQLTYVVMVWAWVAYGLG